MCGDILPLLFTLYSDNEEDSVLDPAHVRSNFDSDIYYLSILPSYPHQGHFRWSAHVHRTGFFTRRFNLWT